MKREEDLERAVEGMIDAIKDSEVYRRYRETLAAVKQQPDLKREIDEFRRENYLMQSSGDMAFEHIEKFEQEYSDFRENPLVADFLAAELALCRMTQQINLHVTDMLDFE
ncbi:MAG: YlbF family regulator [bacterium]|nr:YlbF family regulator [bacterium]MCM1375489.1 YlbF family regulator [Muribaculum sp.]